MYKQLTKPKNILKIIITIIVIWLVSVTIYTTFSSYVEFDYSAEGAVETELLSEIYGENSDDISIESEYALIENEPSLRSRGATTTLDLDYLCGPDPSTIPPPPRWDCRDDRGWCWTITPQIPFPIAQSEITLPYRRLTDSERAVWIAEYFEMGGHIPYEEELIRLINEERVGLGLNALELDPVLAMGTRFHAQIMSTFGVEGNWGHHVGPYSTNGRGASMNTVRVFGAGRTGSLHGNASTGSFNRPPANVVAGLLNSPAHCRNLLNPHSRYIGTGVHVGSQWGSGMGMSSYVMLSSTRALPRHMTTVVDGTISTALGATDIGSFLAHETVSVTADIPTGHRFVRWESTPAVNFVDEENETTTFTMPANAVTVRAITEQEQQATYTISFDANGGINAPDPQTKTHGVDLLLTSHEPSREGYEFLGWATTATATEAEYQPGDTFARNADTTLFAVWEEESIDICDTDTIAQGQFADQPGTDVIAGATWVLCDDGALIVNQGFINWNSFQSPWHNYRGNIYEIEFTGSIFAGTSLFSLFHNLENVTMIKGLEYFDTSQVTNMGFMFSELSNLTSLDVSNFDTSQVTDMSQMFFRMSNLTSLDVSNFDLSQNPVTDAMFADTTSLRVLGLGEQFRFTENERLPAIPQTADYTGYWQNVGEGTEADPTGIHVFTSSQLMSQFNGTTMADTFVWQPVSESPIIILGQLIAEVEAKIQTNYTPRSWAEMMSMLTFARRVYINPTRTDAQYNDAINLLRARLDALVER